MASIRFNQIADARGSINGTVYSRGIGGLYMKNRVSPLNPQSSKQTEVRTRLAVLAASWRSLSDDQRKSWGAQVANYPATNRLGETYIPSGYQLYMTLNSNLLNANETAISSPLSPGSFTANAINTFSMVVTGGALSTGSISLDNTNSATEKTVIEMTGALSAGISSPSGGLFKLVQVAVAAEDSFDIASNYTSIFGVPAVGAKVFVKLYRVLTTTGQKQLLGQTSVVVTTV